MSHSMSEVGAVVRAVDDKHAWVEIDQPGCGRCHEPGGCGGQKITQIFCSGPKRYRVSNVTQLRPGDRVRLGIPQMVLRRSATLAYVLPVLALLLGAVVGMEIAADSGAIIGGVISLFGAWLYLRFHSRSQAVDAAGEPRLLP